MRLRNVRNKWLRRAILVAIVVPWTLLMMFCAAMIALDDDCVPLIRGAWRG